MVLMTLKRRGERRVSVWVGVCVGERERRREGERERGREGEKERRRGECDGVDDLDTLVTPPVTILRGAKEGQRKRGSERRSEGAHATV
jgi:hypothetical protein